MATPPGIIPQTDAERIAALEAKLAALQTAKQPPAWWTALKAKVQATGGWKHAIWLIWLAVATSVAANPAAHSAFLSLWAHVPKWGVDLVTIAAPIVAYFVKPTGGQPPQS